jgi:hypothetical protein
MSRYQIETTIRLQGDGDGDVQAHSADDDAVAAVLAKAMGWDRPAAEGGNDVEGMSMAAPECLCLCSTASGGGGGQALQ